MVALLWSQGNREAAIGLEQLWNDLAKRLPFSLLCAYPIKSFGRESDDAPFRTICGAHSHVMPAESYAALTNTEDRLRVITELQQRATALEGEIADKMRLISVVESSDDAIVSKSPGRHRHELEYRGGAHLRIYGR
jgi:hypothetical protein